VTPIFPRGWPLPAVAALVLACLAAGCKRAAPAAEEKPPPATVKWQGAAELSLEEWTELVGATAPLPDHVARVTAPVEGRVVSILTGADGKPVTEGQHVDKGTVIVQLEDTPIRANLAKLESARDVLREDLRQSQLGVDLATAEVERLRRLGEPVGGTSRGLASVPLVSPVEREKADIALKDAQSKLAAAREKLSAGLKDVEALKEQLRLYTLTAPIAGRVGRVQVVPGQTLAIGTSVAEIVDLDDEIDVLCFVPPSVVHHLRVGQSAKSGPVERDPNSREPEAAGKVAYIAEQAEPETGNFAVKVRFSNKAARLRANRVLRIGVLTGEPKECLALPESAVMEDEDPPTVVVAEKIKTGKNAEQKDETVAVARRLQVELGVRDRKTHAVEIVRLIDPEKAADKKWRGELREAQFVVEGGAGLQTGDALKLEADED
jgi:RND family efflux transporter MFP subunit